MFVQFLTFICFFHFAVKILKSMILTEKSAAFACGFPVAIDRGTQMGPSQILGPLLRPVIALY